MRKPRHSGPYHLRCSIIPVTRAVTDASPAYSRMRPHGSRWNWLLTYFPIGRFRRLPCASLLGAPHPDCRAINPNATEQQILVRLRRPHHANRRRDHFPAAATARSARRRAERRPYSRAQRLVSTSLMFRTRSSSSTSRSSSTTTPPPRDRNKASTISKPKRARRSRCSTTTMPSPGRQHAEQLASRAVQPRSHLGDHFVHLHTMPLRVLQQPQLLPVLVRTLVRRRYARIQNRPQALPIRLPHEPAPPGLFTGSSSAGSVPNNIICRADRAVMPWASAQTDNLTCFSQPFIPVHYSHPPTVATPANSSAA